MKPTKLYFLQIITKGKLRYGQRGGGKFSQKEAMDERADNLARQGIQTEKYEADVVWRKIE